MEEPNLRKKLVDACIIGNVNACISLSHLKLDAPISPLRLHLSRFLGIILLLTLAPVLVGIIAIVFFTDILFGFFAIGFGLIFLVPFLVYRNWFMITSIWRASFMTFLFFVIWIILVIGILSFIIYK